MAEIVQRRMTAELDHDTVVFLIGLRINKLWKVNKWLPVAQAMPRMISELYADPASGFLGAHFWFGRTTIALQYWRSFELLERYAKDATRSHRPAWAAFNRAVGSGGDVGIWHETYRVAAGSHETVYNNMPPFGLAAATRSVPVDGRRESAAQRIAGT